MIFSLKLKQTDAITESYRATLGHIQAAPARRIRRAKGGHLLHVNWSLTDGHPVFDTFTY